MQSLGNSFNRRSHFHSNFLTKIALTFSFVFTATVMTFAEGAGYWHTSGNQILDANNQVVRIAGVNWYGFETTDEIVHGLWAQDYHTILNQIKSNGYNVIRLPFSNQMVENPAVPSNYSQNNGQPINQDLVGLNALQVMDKIVSAAGAIGLRVILDDHRSEAGNSAEANGLWYTSSYPDSAWINDWKTMVTRYQNFKDANGNPIVIGVDLRNEPHLQANGSRTGSCWTGDSSTGGCPTSNTSENWPAAAVRAGNAVAAINPNLLIFVEGVDCYNGDCDWWGGNLEGVENNPVVLNAANHLVYSPHDYGPNLYQQSWFNSNTSFSSLSAVWNKFWGYLITNNIAPVWVGEFGTTNNASDIQSSSPGSEGQWFQSLVNFLENNSSLNWTYWALNGEDSYGLLNNQYSAIANATKQSMLATIQFALSGGGGSPNFSLSANPSSLTINQGAGGTSTITVTPSGGFNGTVSLSASGLPSGVTAGFNPSSTSRTSTLTLMAANSATKGTAIVTITGVSGSLRTTTTTSLTVAASSSPDFSLSASPSTLSVIQGTSGTSTITVTPGGGFKSAVSLSASGLPFGVSASFNPGSTTSSSMLTLTASTTAATGTATITVTAQSGNLSHTTTISLTVPAKSNGTGGVTVSTSIPSASPYYNEEDVDLSTPSSLTALSITIVVEAANGITYNGQYNTVGGQITQGHSTGSSTITYTFRLVSGQTVPSGSFVFAAQTNGTGRQHSFAGDTYTATYTINGQTYTQSGNF